MVAALGAGEHAGVGLSGASGGKGESRPEERRKYGFHAKKIRETGRFRGPSGSK